VNAETGPIADQSEGTLQEKTSGDDEAANELEQFKCGEESFSLSSGLDNRAGTITSITHSRLRAIWPLALAICSAFIQPSAALAASNPTPTLSQLMSELTAASAQTAGPNIQTSIPPLAQIPSIYIHGIPQNCYLGGALITMSPNPAKECAFGQTRASRTILLFGDSQAPMWFPALSNFASTHNWKLIMMAKAACPPWQGPSTSSYQLYGGLTVANCAKRVQDEINVIIKLKPQITIPVGLDIFQPDGVQSTASQNSPAITRLIRALAPAHTKVLLFAPIPLFDSTVTQVSPTQCLSIRASDVKSCALTPTQIASSPIRVAIAEAARTNRTPLVDVLPLFCSSTLCPLFVTHQGQTYLIYQNQWHMNLAYSAFISTALAPLLTNAGIPK
jgi:SGNH domain (fused to AT3 domains)